ncbi:MAG: hypothetical protein ACK41Q_09870, partial [Candidatus Brocadia sp.]
VQTFLRGLSTQKWYFQPLRYPILQGTPILKGVGISILWPQMVALAIMGLVTLWQATRRFRKTLA